MKDLGMLHALSSLAAVLAGLALFLAGMSAMSEGLHAAAGKRLRRILERATRYPFRSLAFGSLLGFLIHSSAASVMLVGFTGAGLMGFAQSIAVMLGINVGTTFSMLLIALRLGDACWIAIVAGLALRRLAARGHTGAIGQAIFGFGLVFLGLNIMSDAIRPFRDGLAPLLAYADGSTISGMLVGTGVSILVTAVIQSSGATIGMTFALISAGVITNLEAAWPLVIGANVGTCATALLGSVGAPRTARRTAMAHLVFNVFSAAVGMLAAPLIYRYVPLTAAAPFDAPPEVFRQVLIRQCANANAIKMALTALMALPATGIIAGIVSRMIPGDDAISVPATHLDPDLTDNPEKALDAALAELARLTGLCRDALWGQQALFSGWDPVLARRGQETELTLDAVKIVMQDYLLRLSQHALSPRQSTMVAFLSRGMTHLERIGDHLENAVRLAYYLRCHQHARASAETLASFGVLNRGACVVLDRLRLALATAGQPISACPSDLASACDDYRRLAAAERGRIVADLGQMRLHPVSAIHQNEYLSDLSRIVEHAYALVAFSDCPEWRERP